MSKINFILGFIAGELLVISLILSAINAKMWIKTVFYWDIRKEIKYIQKIYKDESITLIQGDCLEVMDKIIEKGIKVDMILCDLPYGVTSRNKWDCIINYESLWQRYDLLIKENGAIVLHCQQPFTTELIHSNMKNYKYSWTWYKHQVSGFLNAKKQPLRNCEDIAVFYKKQCTYNPQMIKGKMQLKNTGGDSENYNKFEAQPHYSDEYYPTTLLDFPLRRFKNGHPTQKPVELEEYLIKTYTNEGDIILDNTCGSGSTLIAAKNLNRKCIGIELDDKYCEMAKNRIINIQDVAI